MSGKDVTRAALELLQARQYPSVVAVCTDALTEHPDNLYLRLLRARALLALRRDQEAQGELRECLRRDPNCAQAYRLLGELTLRRDELSSAEVFLREALRIEPGDHEAEDLLEIVLSLNQPTVAVEKLPAATVTVGCTSSSEGSDFPKPRRAVRPPRLAQGTSSEQALARRVGFGSYLVKIGAITPMQLRAALAYHRSAGIRIGAAAVALGFVSSPKVEWAAHSYHARRKQR